ncbi:MAG: hypothetical protein ACRC6I_16500 [Paracoccaceae bacterium]
MTIETLATAEGPGYRLAVEGTPILCVDPEANTSETTHAATLVITNTGQGPVIINHRAGQIAGFSFRADTIADARDPRVTSEYDPGPVAPAAVENATATIPPGETYRFRGDPRYMIQIGNLAKRGQMVDGSTALPEERFDRSFRISFYAFFDLTRDGVKTEVSETMLAMLRVIVRDVASE